MGGSRTISLKELCAILGISRKRLRWWMTAGIVPRPLNPRERVKIWSHDQIDEWLKNPTTRLPSP